MRNAACALAVCAFLVPAALRAQHTLEMIQETGDSENRIDLILLGDGYTETEQDKFVSDTDAIIEGIFDETSFGGYRSFFNIARVKTVSAESGSDHPSLNIYVDSFFNCSYEYGGVFQAIGCKHSLVVSTAAEMYPAYDTIIVLVNDSVYGGASFSGMYAVFSICMWSASGMTHEFGHSLGGLADEYEDPYPGFTFEDTYPNVSTTYEREELKWSIWVDEDTPLPTLESEAVDDLTPVGAYEGACYEPTGRYRPVLNCLMRALGGPMCPVCSEALVLSFYGYVELVDSFLPSQTAVSGVGGEELSFEVDAVEPSEPTLSYTWRIDDQIIDKEGGGALDLAVGQIAPGEHVLSVTVKDETELLRRDPDGMAEQAISWTVTRTDGAGYGDSGADSGMDTDGFEDAGLSLSAGSGGCDCRVAAGDKVGLINVLTFVLFGT